MRSFFIYTTNTHTSVLKHTSMFLKSSQLTCSMHYDLVTTWGGCGYNDQSSNLCGHVPTLSYIYTYRNSKSCFPFPRRVKSKLGLQEHKHMFDRQFVQKPWVPSRVWLEAVSVGIFAMVDDIILW
jgi:hypothetical protein